MTFSFTLTSAYTLTYNTTAANISSLYDENNRVVSKGDVFYVYDSDGFVNDTLTNVSNNDVIIRYEYDDKKRIIKEIKTIDGITFVKVISYDAMDRVDVSTIEHGLDYEYGEDANIESIAQVGKFFNVTYNEHSLVSQREYANSLDTDFTYNSSNVRLQEIKTGSVQELDYTYDGVGNIIGIVDSVNNRIFSMAYDNLNRLVFANVSESGIPSMFNYTYNAIGNLMNVFNDGENTVRVYDAGLAHAPGRILNEEDLSITITNPLQGGSFFDDILNITWISNGNFSTNLLTYTIEYSDNSGSTWQSVDTDVGFTNELDDDSTSHTFTLTAGDSEVVYLKIPKDTTVSRAELNLEGLST